MDTLMDEIKKIENCKIKFLGTSKIKMSFNLEMNRSFQKFRTIKSLIYGSKDLIWEPNDPLPV